MRTLGLLALGALILSGLFYALLQTAPPPDAAAPPTPTRVQDANRITRLCTKA